MINIHKILTTITLTMIVSITYSQQAIVSAGGVQQNDQGYISWSLGETFVQTLTGDDYTLTQGFQQGDLSVTAIQKPTGINAHIQIYPNPTTNILNIQIDQENFKDYSYKIISVNGEIIAHKQFYKSPMQVPFQSDNKGIYILKIIDNENNSKEFKVIKH